MGLIKDKIYYTYEDVTIIPSVISDVEHRSECIPFDDNGMLPLFTAPMDTVINEKNFSLFEENHINAILPRTEPLEKRIEYSVNGKWAAYSLNEFSYVFCNAENKLSSNDKIKALIDVANGHMKKIFELADKSKQIYGESLQLMGGNIANPETYKLYLEHGFWGVRCGIGGGCGCITSSNTSIHYPIASLLLEIHKIKEKMVENGFRKERLTKVIADGGVRNYCDVIKAVGALGADYVMIGSVFAKMFESASQKVYGTMLGIDINSFRDLHYYGNHVGWEGTYEGKKYHIGPVYATFYGMASREGQIAINGAKTKTSEGVKKTLEVEYTMSGWTNNLIDYLRSAMSYTNCHNIKEFNPNNVNSIIISPKAQKSINK